MKEQNALLVKLELYQKEQQLNIVHLQKTVVTLREIVKFRANTTKSMGFHGMSRQTALFKPGQIRIHRLVLLKCIKSLQQCLLVTLHQQKLINGNELLLVLI
uniref:Uncharacterized protein n=1 Tax=Globodera rostochiensis TaxID=31243 RepID=A0A914GY73_GLORO